MTQFCDIGLYWFVMVTGHRGMSHFICWTWHIPLFPDSHSNTLQHTATNCVTVWWVVSHVWLDTFLCVASHCNTLQNTATHCNTLQHTVLQSDESFYTCDWTHSTASRPTLQHTATHCNTLCFGVMNHFTRVTGRIPLCPDPHWNTLQHTVLQSREWFHTCDLTHSSVSRLTLQHTATHCKLPQRTVLQCDESFHTCDWTHSSVSRITLQHTATYCVAVWWVISHVWLDTCLRVPTHTATHCKTLQHTVLQSDESFHTCDWKPSSISRLTLQHTATHCNTLQNTALHCDEWFHTCDWTLAHSSVMRHRFPTFY